jgi:hypothetical protein
MDDGAVVFEAEETDIQGQPVQHVVHAAGIRIRDEHLTEAVAREQLQQVAHPLGVDLVEDVVQQQDRAAA